MSLIAERPIVLVVDDDPAVRLLMRESLEPSGCLVEEAENGQQAVELFGCTAPDLILMDVQMPLMNGFEACRRVRQDDEGRDVPIVIVTGLDDIDSIEKAYEAGATDFITKPIDWLILGQRVRYILRASYAFKQLKANEESLAEAQRIGRFGNWEWDVESGRVHCSEGFLSLIALEGAGPVIEFNRIMDAVHSEDQGRVGDAFQRCLEHGEQFDFECRFDRTDGQHRLFHCRGELVEASGTRLRHVLGTTQDITDERAAEERIQYLAYYDSLTGLPNRTRFRQQAESILLKARTGSTEFAVMVLDIDRLKRINDTLGHSAGDQALKAVAQRLMSAMDEGKQLLWRGKSEYASSIARLGGDEFQLLIPGDGGLEFYTRMAEYLCARLAQPISIEGNEVVVTGSVGIALYPHDGDSIEVLLKNADTAVNYTKKSGRNTYRYYTDSMNSQSLALLQLESQLGSAIDDGQMELFYQPKYDLLTRRLHGVEALIRWHHPQRGLLLPGEFIPLAEENGLIVKLGEWGLSESCAQARSWLDQGVDVGPVAVNISSVQFRSEGLFDTVGRVLQESGLPPCLLEIEVTESSIMHDVEQAERILSKLKLDGVQVSVDDFGTGYSSLSYLKRLPLDTLKIDGSFVKDITTNESDKSIAEAIVALSQALGLEVIAEWVQHTEQARMLDKIGCTKLQGFWISPPLEADQIPDFFSNFTPPDLD
jgi:diguanylate cyclase (GGDEF)-like protein